MDRGFLLKLSTATQGLQKLKMLQLTYQQIKVVNHIN